VQLECGNLPCRIQLATGERVQARSIVIATGARYRRLAVERLEEFEGTSVHYWASALEADLSAGHDVGLIGGGNSAGQATVFLATRARRVTLVARRPLNQTMSQYLIDRITSLANVEIVIGSQVCALSGANGGLEAVTLRTRAGEETRHALRYLFSFIGAEPNTDWLQGSGIQLDERGFVLSSDSGAEDRFPLETSRRGVFAVGDVRSGSVKRVASSVGDGAQAVATIHRYLAAQAERDGQTMPVPPLVDPRLARVDAS
jgi:thioredoxin reductase (NADPH)